MATPGDEGLITCTTPRRRELIVDRPTEFKRACSSPLQATFHHDRPLSARSRELLRRAAANGFRAAAVRDPGGKEAAASRIQAPSPSPTPEPWQEQLETFVQGESMPVRHYVWDRDRPMTSPSGGSKRPGSVGSMSTGRTTPLPILLAQMEDQLLLTPADMVADRRTEKPSPTASPKQQKRTHHVQVHFLEEFREKVPEVPLQCVGQQVGNHVEPPVPAMKPGSPKGTQRVGQQVGNHVEPPVPAMKPGSPKGTQRVVKRTVGRNAHPPRSPRSPPRQVSVDASPPPANIALSGVPVRVHEALSSSVPKKRYTTPSTLGKAEGSRSPVARIAVPCLSPFESPQISLSAQQSKVNSAPHNSSCDEQHFSERIDVWGQDDSFTDYGSLETVPVGILDGRWVHKADPSRTEIIQDDIIRSPDGSVMDLNMRDGGQISRRGAHGQAILGLIDKLGDLVWQNGEVWMRVEEEDQRPTVSATDPPPSRGRRRHPSPRRPRTEESPSHSLPKELKFLMRMIPSSRPKMKPSQTWTTEMSATESSATVWATSSATGDIDPVQEEGFSRVDTATVQVQCTDKDWKAEGASPLDVATSTHAPPRLVLVHRCSPGAVDLSHWREVQQRERPVSQAELYMRSFKDTFPGTMDSTALANKAGGRTLAQAAAAEVVRRSALRASTPKAATWR